MSKMFKKSMFAVGVALLPVLTFAADTGSTVGTILFKIQNIFGIVVPVITRKTGPSRTCTKTLTPALRKPGLFSTTLAKPSA